jgi:hypothetical protein
MTWLVLAIKIILLIILVTLIFGIFIFLAGKDD